MVLWAVRAAFILVIFGVGYGAVMSGARPLGDATWLLLAISIIVGAAVIVGDYLAPRRKLSIFAGAFFGLLVGIVLAYALSFVVSPLADRYVAANPEYFPLPVDSAAFRESLNLFVGSITCYLAISFVLQTKDDFRFIVPYVEFAKQTKGSRPLILDTSALIDGRIADVAETGVFDAQLIVPKFVVNELHQLADSAERLKRNRSRRGLDVLARLQQLKKLDISIPEASHLSAKEQGVDNVLMSLAKELNGRVLTTDFNLNKVAQVNGVEVINLNDLANALKSEVLPGERRTVHIERPGEQANQGVGYLDDGTYVIVEHAKSHIGEDVEIIVTNTRQTSSGKMIFGRVNGPDGDANGSGAPVVTAIAEHVESRREPREDREKPQREAAREGPRDQREQREQRRGNGGFSRSPRRGPPEPRA